MNTDRRNLKHVTIGGKPRHKSMTIRSAWVSIAAGVVFLAAKFGVDLSGLTDTIVTVGVGITMVATGGFSWWGRERATEPIKK